MSLNDAESSTHSPVLSADCVQSVVTINPAPHHPKPINNTLPSVDLKKRRQYPFLNGSASRRSTSVATCSLSSNVGRDDDSGHITTTLVATCNGRPNGRIHLATIVEGHEEDNKDDASRVVKMKYSSKSDDKNNPSFATVCIASAPSRTSAAILGLDVEGKLYAHHFEIDEASGSHDNNQFFDMELCTNNLDGGHQKSSKRGRKSKTPTSMQSGSDDYLFTSMNTLTARMESARAINSKSNASEMRLQKSPRSTPKEKGRKRKASTPSKRDKESRAVYAVASRLNESHLLPSQYPPVIIRLSLDSENDPHHKSALTRASWSKIPGLGEIHSPTTCITYASRSSCGNQLWGALLSMMRRGGRQDDVETNIGNVDEGIVCMGFQNGSLYASTVINGEPGHASRMLRLNSGEPFLSVQILRDEFTEPKLMCVGALGTLAIIDSGKNNAVKVDMKRLPFNGRWCSFACIGYHNNTSTDTDLSLIATNDIGQTHLYQLSLKCKGSNGRHVEKAENLHLLKVFRIPISNGNASIGTKASEFVWSSLGGKVSLIRIAPDLKIRRATRSKHSLLATLRQKENSKFRHITNRRAQERTAVSKYDAAISTLKAAIDAKQERDDIHSSAALLDFRSNQATKEVRDAIRIVSLSSSTTPPPIQCTIDTSKSKAQGFDLGMKNDKLDASSSWLHSIHTTSSQMIRSESIKDMTPLCYRRTRYGLVKVLYGGSSASLSCQNSASMHVSIHDFSPVSVYATLSKIFIENASTDSNPWEESVTLDAKVDTLHITGQAKRAYMQGAVVPFKLGGKCSVPLAGDLLTPLLMLANVIRVKDVSEDSRTAAEKEVQQMVLGAGGRKEKVHCCSSSVLLASSKNIEQYSSDPRDNVGAVPVAVVLKSHKDTGLCELGFAIGSSSNNLNDLMSLLPLMRHSIIRYSQREEDLRLDVLKDECYSRLLSEKRASKIAKHVDQCAQELLSRIDASESNDTCPSAMLTKCVSLYEIMRTLQFIIG